MAFVPETALLDIHLILQLIAVGGITVVIYMLLDVHMRIFVKAHAAFVIRTTRQRNTYHRQYRQKENRSFHIFLCLFAFACINLGTKLI